MWHSSLFLYPLHFSLLSTSNVNEVLGSVCLTGAEGEMDHCIEILSSGICGYRSIKEFDLMQYATEEAAGQFIVHLKVLPHSFPSSKLKRTKIDKKIY